MVKLADDIVSAPGETGEIRGENDLSTLSALSNIDSVDGADSDGSYQNEFFNIDTALRTLARQAWGSITAVLVPTGNRPNADFRFTILIGNTTMSCVYNNVILVHYIISIDHTLLYNVMHVMLPINYYPKARKSRFPVRARNAVIMLCSATLDVRRCLIHRHSLLKHIRNCSSLVYT